MSRLIESIQLRNGTFSRLEQHQARVDHSYHQVFGKLPTWRLHNLLMTYEVPAEGLYKCRVVYDAKTVQAEFSRYHVKPVHTLKLIVDDEMAYAHKWEDRSRLNEAMAQRGNCDDILLVKNGLITDTFYANLAFQMNEEWFTPESFLLPGTMRQFLLDRGVLQKRCIDIHNFREFSRVKLINAMLGWDGPVIPIGNIY